MQRRHLICDSVENGERLAESYQIVSYTYMDNRYAQCLLSVSHIHVKAYKHQKMHVGGTQYVETGYRQTGLRQTSSSPRGTCQSLQGMLLRFGRRFRATT